MYIFSMVVAIGACVVYHLFQKSISSTVDPLASLITTYATALGVTLVAFFLVNRNKGWEEPFRGLNWASIALGVAIVGLEIGFLLVYRSGWKMNIAGAVSNVAVAILLVPLGYLLYQETLSLVNLLGVAFCVVGFILVNQ